MSKSKTVKVTAQGKRRLHKQMCRTGKANGDTMKKSAAKQSPNDLLRPSEVARLVGVSPQLIHRWLDAGRIPYQTVAGIRLVARKDARKPTPIRSGPKPRTSLGTHPT